MLDAVARWAACGGCDSAAEELTELLETACSELGQEGTQ
jgi:hypothetical protein